MTNITWITWCFLWGRKECNRIDLNNGNCGVCTLCLLLYAKCNLHLCIEFNHASKRMLSTFSVEIQVGALDYQIGINAPMFWKILSIDRQIFRLFCLLCLPFVKSVEILNHSRNYCYLSKKRHIIKFKFHERQHYPVDSKAKTHSRSSKPFAFPYHLTIH